MTATELAERDTRQKTYDDMLARQQAYEERFIKQAQQPDHPASMGCVFTKSCNLRNGVINHDNSSGFVPVEKLGDYGHVRPWDKLHQDMKNALIKAKKVDNKGNILGVKK
ncbi:hypothetical protein [Pseudomonas sp. UMAB-40]|uniref:hypothetical protein n=1 Tax=Pseudomonas sp. UMAB-40 TaxID=1365407 RepID=UPI001C5A4286|nr:hypothetical protein [Pseudomonas sp. UMAB-40]